MGNFCTRRWLTNHLRLVWCITQLLDHYWYISIGSINEPHIGGLTFTYRLSRRKIQKHVASRLSNYRYFTSKFFFLTLKIPTKGKDILKFHALYWPSFLLGLDLPLPKKLGIFSKKFPFFFSTWTFFFSSRSRSLDSKRHQNEQISGKCCEST